MQTPARTTHRPLLRRRRRALLAALVLAAALTTTVVVSAALGAARIPLQTTAGVLLESLGSGPSAASESQRQIVRAIRLPRILAAALVGASLALAGATMQAIFRNPMADPGLVGV